jgi:MraZ protein
MFLGQHKHSLDAKGRLSIPKKFLEPLSDPGRARMFYGTRGLEGCLFLLLSDDWEDLVKQVRSSSLGDPKVRGFSRMFFSMARELPVDGTGRILLPQEYRELAGIDREVLLVGVDRRIELWSPERWSKQGQLGEDAYEEYATEIFRA